MELITRVTFKNGSEKMTGLYHHDKIFNRDAISKLVKDEYPDARIISIETTYPVKFTHSEVCKK